MNKKSILHVIDSLKTGGAETLLVGIVRSLPSYNNIIVTLLPDNDFRAQTTSMNIICLHYRNKLCLPRCIRTLRAIIKENKVDIIHSHLLTATFIARLAKPKSIPLLFSVHNILSKSAFKLSKLSWLLEKATYRKSHTAIFVSNEVKRDYKSTVGIRGSHHVLYNYIADEYFKKKLKRQDTNGQLPIRLISVGSLKPQKNYSFLIHALKNWDEQNYTLDIYGDGPLKSQLSNEINKLNLQKNIFLKGKKSNLYDIIVKYDLYIMPSIYEGFGIALLEAMALEIPTLIADIAELKEVSEGNALFFDPYDYNSLIEKLKAFKGNPAIANDNKKKGKLRALELSDRKKYMATLTTIYNKNECN